MPADLRLTTARVLQGPAAIRERLGEYAGGLSQVLCESRPSPRLSHGRDYSGAAISTGETMKLITIKALPCVLMLAAGSASAFDINRLQAIGQNDFRLLSEDVGAALSYHPQTPTEPLGTTGFDVGVSVAMSKVANKDSLSRASSDSVPSYLPIPTLRANKGLPLGFDVGLMYSKVPGSDISLW